MLLSRGATLFRALRTVSQRNAVQVVRNSHTFNYRCPAPPATRRNALITDFVNGFFWWWILWHLWTEPGHVTGEFEYPDPNQWTDEELGIPAE